MFFIYSNDYNTLCLVYNSIIYEIYIEHSSQEMTYESFIVVYHKIMFGIRKCWIWWKYVYCKISLLLDK